jgi:Nucleoporin complex subunit 54
MSCMSRLLPGCAPPQLTFHSTHTHTLLIATPYSLLNSHANPATRCPQEIGKYIGKLHQQHELTTTVKIEEFRRKHMELAHRVLQLMVKIEVLQARGYSILTDEETYRAKLDNLQQELNKPTQFKSQVRELTSLVRMQEDTAVQTYEPLDEQSMRDIHKVGG